MNQPVSSNSPKVGVEDILFECPQCGKSLEIDARGAGYMIVCPDCKNEILVPAWNESEEEIATGDDNVKEALQLLKDKVARLEKLQRADDHCFKRLADEIVLIQTALDRITDIVESRRAEG